MTPQELAAEVERLAEIGHNASCIGFDRPWSAMPEFHKDYDRRATRAIVVALLPSGTAVVEQGKMEMAATNVRKVRGAVAYYHRMFRNEQKLLLDTKDLEQWRDVLDAALSVLQPASTKPEPS